MSEWVEWGVGECGLVSEAGSGGVEGGVGSGGLRVVWGVVG